MAAALLAAATALPQGTGRQYEQPRRWVQVTGIAVDQSLMVGFHDVDIVGSIGAKTVGMGDDDDGTEWGHPSRLIQGLQDQPP